MRTASASVAPGALAPDREALWYFEWAEPLGLSVWSGGAGWATWERDFVRWAEHEGYELDVAISEDLEQHPDVLDGHREGHLAVRRRVGQDGAPIAILRELPVQHPGGELPAEAVKYVRQIESLIECPITLLSTSPERDDTILMRDPFEG